MDKPAKLYRGTAIKRDLFVPEIVLETEKDRFPAGTDAVVFATQHRAEAIAYAITSGRDLGMVQWNPFWKDEANSQIGWRLTLPCRELDFPKDEKCYVYSLNPEHFQQNTVGEWFSVQYETPQDTLEITVGEALNVFDEVHFTLDNEARIKGEGLSGSLK